MPSNIQYINHAQIDKNAWDKAVNATAEGRPYGLSFYLDIICYGNWDALVYKDYEAVLPLPFNTKIPGFIQVYQPPFAQQFAIYGSDIGEKLKESFIASIPSKFKKIDLAIGNFTNTKLAEERTNLELELNFTYDEISRGYSKSLRKRLRQNKALCNVVTGERIDDIVSFYRQNVGSKSGLDDNEFGTALKLFTEAKSKGFCKTYSVLSQSDELLANGIFLDYNKYLINVLGSSNKLGRDSSAMHVLIDHVIEANSSTHNIFDFEGSDLPGVKSFFESFGAVNRPYIKIQRNQLPWLLKTLFTLRKKILK